MTTPMLLRQPPLSPARAALWRMAGRHAFFGLVPVGFTLYICWFAGVHHAFAVDFHYAFWPAGREILRGASPYVATTSPLVRAGVAFVYPAPGGLVFAAFAWLPHVVGDVAFTALSLGAALGALWILGVRDWRLYGLALLWPPVISGWQTANVSLVIAFGVAAVWRLRERPIASGVTLALLVSVKVFVWPLGLWLLATRRYAVLAWTVGATVMVNVFAWAVLGFNQIHAYASLVGAVTKIEERMAYTPMALAMHLGASVGVARVAGVVLAAVAAAYCLVYGRRNREESSLLLAVAVSLLATPIVWRHYFALLIVPVAIARPRFSAVWLLPLVLFPCPVTTPSLWQLSLALAAVASVVAVLLLRPRRVGNLPKVAAAGRERRVVLGLPWRLRWEASKSS
jgi:hypothetical protein